MTHIHAFGIHDEVPEEKQPDLKTLLRELSGTNYRRIDHFVRLAIVGAHKAVAGIELPPETAIYISSGQGNLSVFDRVHDQHHINRMLPKPVDFINLLGNSAGFYVAQHLGLNGKNLFLTHHRFPVQMAAVVAQNDLVLGRQSGALLGGVDEWVTKQKLSHRLFGVDETITLGEGSNWLYLSSIRDGALGTFEVEPRTIDKDQLIETVAGLERGSEIAFSIRFSESDITAVLEAAPGCTRHKRDIAHGYYETKPLFVLNDFLSREKGRLVHLDVSDGAYMMMTVDSHG